MATAPTRQRIRLSFMPTEPNRSLEAMLELALATPGYFERQELVELARVATAALRNAGPLVELGSYCGRSTVVLAAIVARASRQLISIDHHLGSEEMLPPFPYFDPALVDPYSGRFDSLGTLVETLDLAGLRSSVTLLVANNRQADAMLRAPAAFVLIDGGHDQISPWWDLKIALRLLPKGGLLALHDVFENPSDGGRPPFWVMEAALHLGFAPFARLRSLATLVRNSDP